MPGYQAKTPTDGEEDDETPEQKAAREPYVYDARHTHIVRATALTTGDAMGDFEAEILKVGNAIVHDKIVIIDPMSDDCVVATGSHNLGYKASYENDENMVIIRGNKALAQAYAVHATTSTTTIASAPGRRRTRSITSRSSTAISRQAMAGCRIM